MIHQSYLPRVILLSGSDRLGPEGGFLVAIWFNNIPEKTVTWSANRDALVPRGSKLQLTLGSRLVITDAGGSEMQLIANGTSATLDDSGNLVLADDSGNLVQLIGVCNEEQHRLLVYEYMPNGSLADTLVQVQRPNLSRRMKFGLETARGLNYLHGECSIQIIHCDIKLQNILLDDSSTARISDFGIAKLLKKDQVHTMTGIRGTKGYVAPEWFKSVPVTSKVDVYSYGIFLLELICCRRCFEAGMEDENQMVLADWAYDCFQEGRFDKLVEDDDEALTEIERICSI